MNTDLLQTPGPLLTQLLAAQRVEEEAVCYPQIESWADALVTRATQLPRCVIWPVGAPAERIAGVAIARARGRVDVGLWNAPVEGRTVLLFAVAGVTPLSLTITAEQLRRRGAAEVHACGIAITGVAATGGIDSFRSLAEAVARLASAAAA
jgi:hypothetical protein